MLTVNQDRDKVVIHLGGRCRDVLLTPEEAFRLADSVDEVVPLAESAPPGLILNQQWNIYIGFRDGSVVLRVTPPFVGNADRVPFPPKAARAFARRLRDNATAAGQAVHLRVVNTGTGGA